MTVLMPVYNVEPYLEESVRSILSQTYTAFACLVIDDGSTDRTREILETFRDPRLRVVRNEENLGLTRTLNRGLSMIDSELVARMDGDDVAMPSLLEREVAFLDSHPDVAVVGVQARAMDARGRRLHQVALWHRGLRRPPGGVAMAWYRMFDTPFVHPGTMFRRSVVHEYPADAPMAEDAALWARVGRTHALANLTETLVAYRVNRSGSMTFNLAQRARLGYVGWKSKLVHGLLRDGLEWSDELLERCASLWVRANEPGDSLTRDEVRELLDAIDACSARFDALHPEARRDRFIATHRATLVQRAMAHAPSPRAFAKMLRLDAATALLALPHIAGKALLRRRRA
ncbi:MAG TPA: glycosyltransferase [Thermoanaerobaculia bacterium]|nr:glycosyltransferase [Thermoanaerobaculia bacterium]